MKSQIELNQDNELPEVYYGLYPEQVIYANMPASNNRLSVKFRDCEVIVANLKMLDSYDCFFRGDPVFVSQAVLSDIVVSASNVKGMTVRVIYPQWKKDARIQLPPHRYEMMIKHYEPRDKSVPHGDVDWYFLKLIWFDDAPSPDQSLADYISSITSQLDFFELTRKLTDKEKYLWC